MKNEENYEIKQNEKSNESKTTENDKLCIICLEGNDLIEYNHCGKYYVHNSCLNTWTNNECLICREKIYNSHNDYNTFNNLPITNSITINITEPYSDTIENDARNRCYRIVIYVHILGIGLILMMNYI
jgi:hypothetical protein